jgi:hypothetical protein
MKDNNVSSQSVQQPGVNNDTQCDPRWLEVRERAAKSPFTMRWEPCFVKDLRRHITEQVALGFLSKDEIPKDAVEVYTIDLKGLVAMIVPEVIATQLQAETTWPAVTDFDKLDASFQELEVKGIVCRHNWGFGSGEGCNDMLDIMEDDSRGYAFYDVQEALFVISRKSLRLTFGVNEELDPLPDVKSVGQDIVDALKRHGLDPKWDGDEDSFIEVPIDWKRRWSGKGEQELDEQNPENNETE